MNRKAKSLMCGLLTLTVFFTAGCDLDNVPDGSPIVEVDLYDYDFDPPIPVPE